MLIKVYCQYRYSNGVLVSNFIAAFTDMDMFENCKEGFYKDLRDEEIVIKVIEFDYDYIREKLKDNYLRHQIDTLALIRFAESYIPDDNDDFIYKFKSVVRGFPAVKSILEHYE